MDIREILNQVLLQSGFLERASFFSSSDPDDKQMTAIANRVAYEIYNFYNWSPLRATHTLTMTETGGVPDTVYDLPDDFQALVPDSAWETDGSRRVELPTPENRWFMYKYTAFSDGGMFRTRLYGKTIEIHDPEPGESFQFEYITNLPVTDTNSVAKEKFTTDTDQFNLDDQLLTLGIQAHWAQTKLMPQYQEWYHNYISKMNEAIARDAGSRTLGGPNEGDWITRRSPYYPLYR